jgi:hypothetical protein
MPADKGATKPESIRSLTLGVLLRADPPTECGIAAAKTVGRGLKCAPTDPKS